MYLFVCKQSSYYRLSGYMNKIQRELFKISAKHVIILCLRVNGDIHKIPKIYRSKYVGMCFVHPIFSSFGFCYFGHFSCVIFSPSRSCPSCLAKCKQRLCNILYFWNFFAKSDQKPKPKNGMNKTMKVNNARKTKKWI